MTSHQSIERMDKDGGHFTVPNMKLLLLIVLLPAIAVHATRPVEDAKELTKLSDAIDDRNTTDLVVIVRVSLFWSFNATIISR